jgi:hypothetical protein
LAVLDRFAFGAVGEIQTRPRLLDEVGVDLLDHSLVECAVLLAGNLHTVEHL